MEIDILWMHLIHFNADSLLSVGSSAHPGFLLGPHYVSVCHPGPPGLRPMVSASD